MTEGVAAAGCRPSRTPASPRLLEAEEHAPGPSTGFAGAADRRLASRGEGGRGGEVTPAAPNERICGGGGNALRCLPTARAEEGAGWSNSPPATACRAMAAAPRRSAMAGCGRSISQNRVVKFNVHRRRVSATCPSCNQMGEVHLIDTLPPRTYTHTHPQWHRSPRGPEEEGSSLSAWVVWMDGSRIMDRPPSWVPLSAGPLSRCFAGRSGWGRATCGTRYRFRREGPACSPACALPRQAPSSLGTAALRAARLRPLFR